MRECEDLIKSVHQEVTRDCNSRLTHEWGIAKMQHTCEACGKLKGQDSSINTGQKVQFGQSGNWRLELATHPSHEVSH